MRTERDLSETEEPQEDLPVDLENCQLKQQQHTLGATGGPPGGP